MIETAHIKQLFRPHGRIGIAVSGGGDSMALLSLMAHAFRSSSHNLFVLSVNHGLRAEAEAEIHVVRAFCEDQGLQHETLVWEDLKPDRGLSEAAREARYRLLGEACERHKLGAVALGHTQDDLAETILMRLQRLSDESDFRGLSGIAESATMMVGPCDHVELIRPLLKVKRANLRDYLKERGVGWIDDPTNENLDYERVKLRQILKADPALSEKLIAFGRVLTKERRALAAQTGDFLKTCVTLRSDFGFEMSMNALKASRTPVRTLVLQTLLSVAGGTDFLPSRRKIEKIWAKLDACHQITLGRCLLKSSVEKLTIVREVRNLPAPIFLHDKPILWDNRLWIWRTEMSVAPMRIATGADVNDIEKSIRTIPYVELRVNDNEQESSQFREITRVNNVNIRLRLGAFETFSSHWDSPIRLALSELALDPVHNNHDK